MTAPAGRPPLPPPPPPRPAVTTWRLLATLAVAGGAAGLLIVFVYLWTQPTIQAYKAEQLRAAIHEVLKSPDRYETLYVFEGGLHATVPAGQDSSDLERIYVGYEASGRRIGYAIAAGEPGFQDIVRLIFGYDPGNGDVLGMKVLESKETPGLGDKIEKDSAFVSQFARAQAPLTGVKRGSADPTARHEVDMITGATISSRTVIRIINNAIERLEPVLREPRAEVSP